MAGLPRFLSRNVRFRRATPYIFPSLLRGIYRTVRAARRYKENIERGMTDQSLAEIEADIEARDLYDSTREHSPLKQAEDAILVDTSHETLDSLLAKLTEMIQKRM